MVARESWRDVQVWYLWQKLAQKCMIIIEQNPLEEIQVVRFWVRELGCKVSIQPSLFIIEPSHKSHHQSHPLIIWTLPRVITISLSRWYLILLYYSLWYVDYRFKFLVSIHRRKFSLCFLKDFDYYLFADFGILCSLPQNILCHGTSLSNHILNLLYVCHLVIMDLLVNNVFLTVLFNQFILFRTRLLRVGTILGILWAEKVKINPRLLALSYDSFELVCNGQYLQCFKIEWCGL